MESIGNRKWFVARTRPGTEVSARNHLEKMGVEHFVPTIRRPGWRGRTIEKPVINGLIFLRATRDEALELRRAQGLRADYLFDCTTRRMMVIRDKAMGDFQRVLAFSTSHDSLIERPLAQGEYVRVTRGPLRGVEGRILTIQGRNYVAVSLLELLFARAIVPKEWLEIIS